jgi:hypothetical protein
MRVGTVTSGSFRRRHLFLRGKNGVGRRRRSVRRRRTVIVWRERSRRIRWGEKMR